MIYKNTIFDYYDFNNNKFLILKSVSLLSNKCFELFTWTDNFENSHIGFNNDKCNMIVKYVNNYKIKSCFDKYFRENYELPYIRNIDNQFIPVFQLETDKIGKNNKINCDNNIKFIEKLNITNGKNICFCCGNDITNDSKKVGDHVIPIVTMLVTFIPDTVQYNMIYIHNECNLQKRDYDILWLWNNVGSKSVFSKSDGSYATQALCRTILYKILERIQFRPSIDIDLRKSYLPEFSNKISELKNLMKFRFADVTIASQILTNMREKTPPNEIEFLKISEIKRRKSSQIVHAVQGLMSLSKKRNFMRMKGINLKPINKTIKKRK